MADRNITDYLGFEYRMTETGKVVARMAKGKRAKKNRHLRRMVAERKPRSDIERELKKPGSGYTSIRENAVKLALAGITTLEEILRVINEED